MLGNLHPTDFVKLNVSNSSYLWISQHQVLKYEKLLI